MQGGLDPSQPWQNAATEAVWTCEVFQTGLKFFLRSQVAGDAESRRYGRTVFHMVVPIFPCFTLYLTEQEVVQGDSWLYILNELKHLYTEVMNREESQSNPVLYSTGGRALWQTLNANTRI